MVKKMILVVLLLSFPATALAQKKEKKPAPTGERVLWREPSDIESRDLFNGPGGEAMKPDLSRVTFLKDQAGQATQRCVSRSQLLDRRSADFDQCNPGQD